MNIRIIFILFDKDNNANYFLMKHLLYFLILLSFSLFSSAQKANFRPAEKFMEDNLATTYGDLDVSANWIEESDIF